MTKSSHALGVVSAKQRGVSNVFISSSLGRVWVIVVLLALIPNSHAAVDVLTQHNDVARMGANLNETVLTPAKVNASGFGKIFSHAVDGYVYAQPLLLSDVVIPGKGTHNIVIVATEHDSVYAFDADDSDGNNAGPLWQVSFINLAAGVTTVPTGDVGSGDIVPEIGITSTPVIDPTTGTLYVEVKTKEPSNKYVHRLHALEVATGAERPGSPVQITASIKGTGDGNNGAGSVPFNGLREMNRPGLALVTPTGHTRPLVYLAYASHGDNGPYHGWILGYDTQTLQLSQVFNTTPNGGLGGIWMAGCGPAFDSNGNLYVITGNGTFSPAQGNYGDSFLKISTESSGLVLADYFTPFNQDALNSTDADLGSGGAVVLPDSVGSAAHPHLLVGCGKEGKIYLLDRDSMGHFHAGNDTQIVQSLAGKIGGTWSTPAFYKNRLYYQGSGDVLKSLPFANGKLTGVIQSQSTTAFGFPGATPSISANGDTNGIAWVLQTDAYGSRGTAVLHAYNAENLAVELYHSNQRGTRDVPGPAVKFTLPTVANGKVYVGSGTALSVYGLGSWVATPTITPPGGAVNATITVTITDSTPGAEIRYTTDASPPMANSMLYSKPILVTKTTVIKAVAFKVGMVDSDIASATFLEPNSIGKGTGLLGSYWSNQLKTFTGKPTLIRLDRTVDFEWGNGSPAPAISADHFTARWTGQVGAQFSETYTFYTTTDDGVRLWLNGRKIIDQWVDQGPTEWSSTIALAAGQRYDVLLEYYENGGGATAHLSWSGPSTPKTIIPQAQLYPPNQPPGVALTSPVNGFSVAGPASVTLVADATDADGTISKVDFLADGALVGSVTTPPYSITWTKAAEGHHTLTAVATDDRGTANTSSVVAISVTLGSGARFGIEVRPQVIPYLGFPSHPTDPAPRLLSETRAFIDITTLAPATGMIPFVPNAPFWSDGAMKQRWMAVPYDGGPQRPSQQIEFSPDENWVFPIGTVFVKHFELLTNETDSASLRRLETRILVNAGEGRVYGGTYRWRTDYSDADYVETAQEEEIAIVTATGTRIQRWYYPSPADCLTCHTVQAGGILGASKTRQLNGPLHYPGSAETDNQLRALNHIGLFHPALDEAALAGYIRVVPVGEVTESLTARARSFLDVNCAYCHQPGGVRANFDARFSTPLAASGLLNGAVIANLGLVGTQVISPGDPTLSAVWARVGSTNPLAKMPPLAHNEVDVTARNVLAEWIKSLVGPAPELAASLRGDLLWVTWKSSANSFRLETRSGIGDETPWQPGPAAVQADQTFTATLPVVGGGMLVRLTSRRVVP